ncbi:MAG TPA: NADPH-dependent FMN reductase [Verrucomicrobiae bacterium]|nr:NADPH-dependent FMN reductase [Verrucomicrobiae bacterium]
MMSTAEIFKIAVIAGTAREQRRSIAAARFVADIGRQLDGVSILAVDPQDFVLSGDGNAPEHKDPRYTQITHEADAFFIVTPEYNRSFPGSLKRLLDSELEGYSHKPVALAGVSDGPWGGVRAVEALLGTVRHLGLITTSYDVYFPEIQKIFDTDCTIKPEYATTYQRQVTKAYRQLIGLARVLRDARDKGLI